MILSLPCSIKSQKCVTPKISLHCNFEKNTRIVGMLSKCRLCLNLKKKGSRTRLPLMTNRGQLTFMPSKEGERVGGGGRPKDAIGNFMQNNETSQTVGSTNDLPTFSRVQTRQYLAKN